MRQALFAAAACAVALILPHPAGIAEAEPEAGSPLSMVNQMVVPQAARDTPGNYRGCPEPGGTPASNDARAGALLLSLADLGPGWAANPGTTFTARPDKDLVAAAVSSFAMDSVQVIEIVQIRTSATSALQGVTDIASDVACTVAGWNSGAADTTDLQFYDGSSQLLAFPQYGEASLAYELTATVTATNGEETDTWVLDSLQIGMAVGHVNVGLMIINPFDLPVETLVRIATRAQDLAR